MARNKFSLSHYKLGTCDMGELIPIACVEALPGDTIQQNTNLFIRASPLLAPVMHPVHVNVYHFFVPFRIIWEDFEDFITGGEDGMDASVVPYMELNSSNAGVGSLSDYLGIVGPALTQAYSCLPHRAYNLIWNEIFRNQDLQTPLVNSTASGLDNTSNKTLQFANWDNDYFTSAKPWEQKGPAVNVPVNSSGVDFDLRTNTNASFNRKMTATGVATPPLSLTAGSNSTAATGVRFGTETGLQVSLMQLREAFAMLRFEEARARYGSRYVEYLRYLGVRSSDARLQRPEYLGGGRQTIQFSEVLQTAEGTDPVGDLKGHGIGAMRSNRFRRYIEEHGLIMTLMCVKPKPIYVQGTPRMFRKTTRDEFWQKELEHIGQQEVLVGEVYAPSLSPNDVFGYQNRYEEYRREPSRVSGEFRTTNLDYWHFARIFSSQPALNAAFVSCQPTDRPFAVPSLDVLQFEAHHSIQARRLVSSSTSSYVY